MNDTNLRQIEEISKEMIELNTIYNEDCLEGMKRIPDGSVDMILCDLPYGTTANKWDTIIPFNKLWEQYERLIKDNGAIVLFGQEPFSSHLRLSNQKLYRYDWIWEKPQGANFMLAKRQPMRVFENISVFYKKQSKYNPIMEEGTPYVSGGGTSGANFGFTPKTKTINTGTRYPRSVIRFSTGNKRKYNHPTQKPVALFEYLIKTYTNKGDTVLDNCMGSGTTAIACLNTERNFIGFELDKEYFEVAQTRIEEKQIQIALLDEEETE